MSQAAAAAAPHDIVADVIDEGRVSRQQVLVVGLCLLLNMLDGFDITAMSVVAGSVADELQLTADRLGLIFSFALAGMMTGAMVLATLSDILGRRTVIVSSVAMVGVSILLTARAVTLTEFFVLRFISGLGAGAIIATQATLAAEYSPHKYRSLSIASTTAGYPLGAVMTSVIAGVIMPVYGWRGMFWFGGAVTLGLGLVAWALMPESLKYLLARRPASALARVNKILRKLGSEPLQALPDLPRGSIPKRSGFLAKIKALLSAEHRGTTLTLWASFFLCFCALYFLMSWIPRLMEQTGYAAEVGRRAFFLFNLGGVIGIFVLGTLSTRWKLSNLVFAFLLSSAAGMVVFAALPGRLSVMMGVIFLVGLLQQGGFTGLYAVAGKVYPTEVRSTGIGWCVGLGRSGAVVGPAVAGFLIAAGVSMSANYYIFAIPLALGGLLAYRVRVA